MPASVFAVIPAPIEPTRQTDQCDRPSRQRHGAAPRRYTRLTIISAATVAGLVVATGLALVVRHIINTSRLEAEVSEQLLNLNRSSALNAELLFWTLRLVDPLTLLEVKQEADAARDLVEKTEVELDDRWGPDRIGLRRLNPRKSEAYTSLSHGTETLVSARLALNGHRLESELLKLETDLRAAHPRKAVLIPYIDRTTAAGEREYQMALKLQPIQQREDDAIREIRILDQVKAKTPGIVRKWVNRTRAENKAAIAELERTYRGVR